MTPDLNAALARAIARANPVDKGALNAFHKYKYASAESLIDEARIALASEGLAVIPLSHTLVPREGDGYFADLRAEYLVTHASGQAVTCVSTTPCIAEKGRPHDKAVATASTYALGYFLRGLLLLPRVDESHEVDRRDDRPKVPQRPAANGNRDDGDARIDTLLVDMAACATEDDLRAVGARVPPDITAASQARLRAGYAKRAAEIRSGRQAS
jgi:hypothetical protein